MSEIIKIDGFAELEKTLGELSDPKFAKAMVKSALRRAAKPLIKSARDKVMGYSQTVGKSITVNYQSKDGATIGIGPKRKADRVAYSDADASWLIAGSGRDPWFAHFIEFGVSGVGRFKTAKGKGSSKRRYRSDQPARPFMRPAFDETKEEVMSNFGSSIMESLEKYEAKTGKHVA